MSDFSAQLDTLASQQIRERTSPATRAAVSGARPRGRTGLAYRLHALAERLDG